MGKEKNGEYLGRERLTRPDEKPKKERKGNGNLQLCFLSFSFLLLGSLEHEAKQLRKAVCIHVCVFGIF